MRTRFAQLTADAETPSTIRLSFASEEPYRGEILRMSGADFSRLENGAVLWNHDRDKLVAIPRNIRIEKNKAGKLVAVADIDLLDTNEANMIRKAFAAGWRGDASVSYEYDDDAVRMLTRDTFEVIAWRALEISLVTVPADPSVGVGRSAQIDTITEIMETIKPDSPPELRAYEDAASLPIFATLPEHERTACIADAFQRGASVRDLQSAMLQRLSQKQPPIAHVQTCSKRDEARYSLAKVVKASLRGQQPDGLELERSQELSRVYGRNPECAFVPREVISGRRDHWATQPTAGGYLTTTENRTDELISYLYPQSLIARLGARTLANLTSNIAIPVHNNALTASWVGEGVAATETNATFGQKVATPHGISGWSDISKQLIMMASPDAESFLRDNIRQAISTAMDVAFLVGSGAAQPKGLYLESGIGTVTYGGAPTFADVVEHTKQMEQDNYLPVAPVWILNPTTKARWQTVLKDSVAGAGYLINEAGEAGGYRSVFTTSVPSTGTYTNRSALVDPSTILICSWFAPEITTVVDATLATQMQVRVVIHDHIDYVFTRPEALVVSTDSAAQ